MLSKRPNTPRLLQAQPHVLTTEEGALRRNCPPQLLSSCPSMRGLSMPQDGKRPGAREREEKQDGVRTEGDLQGFASICMVSSSLDQCPGEASSSHPPCSTLLTLADKSQYTCSQSTDSPKSQLPKTLACLGDPGSRGGAVPLGAGLCGGRPGWRGLSLSQEGPSCHRWAGRGGIWYMVCGGLLLMRRNQQCEPAGGPLCEWPAPAPGHQAADCAAGSQRDAAV